MSVAGFGEYHPLGSNDTPEGRNRNRRVVLVVLGTSDPAPVSAASGDAKSAAAASNLPTGASGAAGDIAAAVPVSAMVSP
jgi:chemotaxis protein MotB